MTRIVHTTYRHKCPPRKQKPNPAALAMPVIVTAKEPKPGDRPVRRTSDATPSPERTAPANDDRKSAIVTIRSRKRVALDRVPEVTPEEHKRQGDAAETLFREVTRRIGEKVRSSYHATITIPCQSPSKMLAPLRCSPVARGIGTPNLEPPLLPVRGGGPFARA